VAGRSAACAVPPGLERGPSGRSPCGCRCRKPLQGFHQRICCLEGVRAGQLGIDAPVVGQADIEAAMLTRPVRSPVSRDAESPDIYHDISVEDRVPQHLTVSGVGAFCLLSFLWPGGLKDNWLAAWYSARASSTGASLCSRGLGPQFPYALLSWLGAKSCKSPRTASAVDWMRCPTVRAAAFLQWHWRFRL